MLDAAAEQGDLQGIRSTLNSSPVSVSWLPPHRMHCKKAYNSAWLSLLESHSCLQQEICCLSAQAS